MTSDAARRADRLSTPAPRSLETKQAGPRQTGRKTRAAIIAVHGMGQQNRHETMASLARRLFDMTRDPGAESAKIQVVDRKMPGRRSQVCCEFTVPTVDGDEKDVSIFEVYWAPLTEGKIGFWETAWFLFVSGLWGIVLTLKDASRRHGFQRWLFDAVHHYGVSWRTFPLLGVTFAGTTGVVVVMMAGLAVLGAQLAVLAAQNFSPTPVTLQPVSLFAAIDTIQSHFAAATLTVALCFLAAVIIGGVQTITRSRCCIAVIRSVLILLVVLLAVFTALCGSAIVGETTQAFLDYLRWPSPGSSDILTRPDAWLHVVASHLPFHLSLTWTIASNLVIFGAIYFFGKQFVGDVAIYVSAHRVNRYWETREAVRTVAHAVASDIYHCRDDNEYRYDEVYFVAHSLGSVIAYDTINAIFKDETVLRQRLDVVRRTRGLLTYGSPLDKTAFLFRAYSDGSIERLAAVAASQPLTLSREFRRFPWINIHSVADPFSAPLEYYGLPGHPLVDNRADRDAFVPFLAHTQYEDHRAFGKALCELLGARRT